MGSKFALRDYQARVVNALVRQVGTHRGETLTVMFPRQAGKNQVSAVLVASLLRAKAGKGGTIVVCAPTQRPQARISMVRTYQALHQTARLFPAGPAIKVDESTITVGQASAVFLSASPDAHVAGHTASIALIADEAQDIDEDWFDRQFRPMAASTGAPVILFGTPWNGETLLEKAAAANRARDEADPSLMYFEGPGGFLPLHHHVGWRTVAQTRPGYGDHVRKERARLGANNPIFLSQYELVASQAEGRLFSPEQLDRLRGEHPALEGPAAGERYAAGLDLGGAGEGADATVLTIGRVAIQGGRCEVVFHRTWRSQPLTKQVAEIAAIAREWRIERLCADATGMGLGLVAQLTEELGRRVEGVPFTSQSKAAMGFALIAAAETGRLALYGDDGSRDFAECLAEVRACRSTLRGGRGQLAWFAPAGHHDDYVASLALLLRAAESMGAPRVATGRRQRTGHAGNREEGTGNSHVA